MTVQLDYPVVRLSNKGTWVEQPRQNTGFLFLPVTKEFYGIYDSYLGNCAGFFQKGKKNYLSGETISIDKPMTTKSKSPKTTEAIIFYRLFLDHYVLQGIEEDFKFPIRELTTREQMWFVNSLCGYKSEQEKTVSSFTQKFGLNGARAFLSCEYGDKFRETVLAIGEKLLEELARQVFEQYGQLALLAQEKAGELIKEFTTDGQDLKIDAAAVEQELLRRAKDFLMEISTMAKTSPEVIQERLARYETDMVVFAGLFRAAFKQTGKIELETIKGLKLESFTPEQISDTDKKEMLKIFSENWKKMKPEVEADLTLELKEKLSQKDPKYVFNIFKKDGTIIAFNRFEEFGTRPVAIYPIIV